MENVSVVTELTLEGLDLPWGQRVALFCVSLLWYSLIVAGNMIIILAVILDKSLHEPMYILLCNLCTNALYGTLGFYPKFLFDLLSSRHVISYAGCLLQGFVTHSSVCVDFTFLAVMAFDRYVALCRPLVYNAVLTRQTLCVLVFLSWLVPLLCMFMNTASVMQAPLCNSHISRLYCINFMVASIACTLPLANFYLTCFNVAFYFCHFLFIFWSYVYLVKTCLIGKKKLSKFMQTCMPHLVSLSMSAVAVLLDVLYARFGSPDLHQHLTNFMAIQMMLIPPMLNPIVYGMNLTKIRVWILEILHFQRTDV